MFFKDSKYANKRSNHVIQHKEYFFKFILHRRLRRMFPAKYFQDTHKYLFSKFTTLEATLIRRPIICNKSTFLEYLDQSFS